MVAQSVQDQRWGAWKLLTEWINFLVALQQYITVVLQIKLRRKWQDFKANYWFCESQPNRKRSRREHQYEQELSSTNQISERADKDKANGISLFFVIKLTHIIMKWIILHNCDNERHGVRYMDPRYKNITSYNFWTSKQTWPCSPTVVGH